MFVTEAVETHQMPAPFSPQKPLEQWIAQFIQPSLLAAKSYQLDAPGVEIKLDQNESPYDWPLEFKERVLKSLSRKPWNRYPEPYPNALAALVAKDVGLCSDKEIILGPGSNYMITLLMDALCRKPGTRLIISRPSFPLYESHATYSGLAFVNWHLSADLEFDLSLIPPLGAGSVVLFASPNNPVGNSLSSANLASLLSANPEALFIADEAYFEFSDDPYTNLLATFHNLVIIRTFSKALGAAGVRLGYVMGSEPLLNEVRKLRLPYLLNQFSIAAAETVLSSPDIRKFFRDSVLAIRTERDRVYKALLPLSVAHGFTTKPTQANFLLLKWKDNSAALAVHRELVARNILIRNVSGAPGMTGCLRVTISTHSENDWFLEAFAAAI